MFIFEGTAFGSEYGLNKRMVKYSLAYSTQEDTKGGCEMMAHALDQGSVPPGAALTDLG